MRLEIIIDDDQPLFFPFRSKVTIGSDPACEIVIEHPEVSRRHATAYPEEDRFYIVDQGSKNGTYLNDERLIPGKKTEFTSFFPVRLGKSILISLISDVEVDEPSKIEIPLPPLPKATPARNQDATTLVSLKELQSARTETLTKKRTAERKATQGKKEAPGKKKPVPKKKKISGSQIMAFLIVLSAVGYQYSLREDSKPDSTVSQGPLKAPEERNVPVVVEEKISPTPADLLLKKLESKGCETDAEKLICSRIPHLRFLKIEESGIDMIVDAAPYQEEATNFLREYTTKAELKEYDPESKEVAMIMAAQFFSRNLATFPYGDYPGKIVTVAFVFKLGEIETFFALAAYKTDTIPSLNILLTPQVLQQIKAGGPAGLDFTRRFYRSWNRDEIPWEAPPGTDTPPAEAPDTSMPENSGTPGPETSTPPSNSP